jgi:hypothetical protein
MLVAIPNNATLWADKQWAAEQEARAQTPDQLRQTLHFAVSRTSSCLGTQTAFLYTFMVANCGAVAFLGWNLLLLRRLKREESGDQST